jgi:putative thiamine transport system substrate-binding protein
VLQPYKFWFPVFPGLIFFMIFKNLSRRRALQLTALCGLPGLIPSLVRAESDAPRLADWASTVQRGKGQTVFWNAWGGDERTNAFIAWVGDEVQKRYGVTVRQVKLGDTAEAVTRVVSEKSAGRDSGGSVDLIWINGPNLLAMKTQHLLYGPVDQALPNYRFVDTTKKRSNVIDFTEPVDGLAVPWRVAQFVFVYDSGRYRLADMPKSAPAMLDFARAHPGRVTHPVASNFLGATFLKQALVDLLPDAAVLQQPATDATFASITAPMWQWYAQLRPLLWREGKEFPASGPAQRQLMNDGAIDIHMAFDPSEAATSIASQLLPPGARDFVFKKGMIGNTSFVAIPYNATHKDGALVVANFLLEPATQARAQDPTWGGNLTVLDIDKVPATDRPLFAPKAGMPGLPTRADLGTPLLEPHPSWMTRITAEWEKQTVR